MGHALLKHIDNSENEQKYVKCKNRSTRHIRTKWLIKKCDGMAITSTIYLVVQNLQYN